jgi:hypothetical protein
LELRLCVVRVCMHLSERRQGLVASLQRRGQTRAEGRGFQGGSTYMSEFPGELSRSPSLEREN